MHPRASFLIETLGLTPHPEGGFFREIFRSSSIITVDSSGARRTAITCIYYLLPAGQVSKLHRVTSDEVWHFIEGDPLELYVLDPSLASFRTGLVGPASEPAQPIFPVPANHWQAAIPRGAFTLASCTVGPGFDVEDFTLLADDASLAEKVKQDFPDIAAML